MPSPTSNDLGKRPVSVDDDSDVDDLDDVLDDFTQKPTAKPAPPNTKTMIGPSPPPTTSPRPPPDAQEMNFVEELARGMEAMLLEMETQQNPPSTAGGASTSDVNAGEDTARDKQFLAAWEDLFAKSLAGVSSEVPDDDEADAAGESEDAFQKSLQEAAERLRRSDAELQAGPQADDDDLAALLDSGDDASLQNLLEGMMGQLMCKEVLYEPLKELNDKFPSYLASNRDKLSASDLARYKAQHACSSQIVAVFDDSGYKDDDPEMTTKVIALMSKMQEHGAPPAEIMGELPPGLDLGPDGAPKLPDGCMIG